VDEVSHSSMPKRTRVLRAADVIPPFDKCVRPADNGRTEAQPPQVPPPQANDHEDGPEGCCVPGPNGLSARPVPADAGIPVYDLAANILAEQRRAAGRRRRKPGRTEQQPVASFRSVGARVPVAGLASQDLLELQRIVAEIVARDIDRLCRRPDRPAPAVCP
jgi:hypothetical protein